LLFPDRLIKFYCYS